MYWLYSHTQISEVVKPDLILCVILDHCLMMTLDDYPIVVSCSNGVSSRHYSALQKRLVLLPGKKFILAITRHAGMDGPVSRSCSLDPRRRGCSKPCSLSNSHEISCCRFDLNLPEG